MKPERIQTPTSAPKRGGTKLLPPRTFLTDKTLFAVRSRHGVEMAKILIGEERWDLLALDLQEVAPTSRAELMLLRDGLFQLSLQVDHLAGGFEALVGKCRKTATLT